MADLTAMLQAAAGQVGGEYQISRSLRFNSADSAYLSRTPASAGDRKTWTMSFWVKLGDLTKSGTSGWNTIFGAYTDNNNRLFAYTRDSTNGNVFQIFNNTGGSTNLQLVSNQLFRDASAWYHFVVALDTTQATSADRCKVYVNGSQITSWATAAYPAQNADLFFNNNNVHLIGANYFSGLSLYHDGYLTETNFVDGQALTPSSFGEFNATTGVWSPIAYAGSYGTNGFYLDFSDNTSTTTLGYDAAGSNDWTLNNFSVTAGAGNDSLVDTPTQYGTDTGAGGEVRGNYATLNPLDSALTGLNNGNLNSGTSGAANWKHCRSTFAMSTGKWYWECLVSGAPDGSNGYQTGVLTGSASLTADPNSASTGFYTRQSTNKYANGTRTDPYFTSTTSNDVLMFAFDADTGKMWNGKNGTWEVSGDPAAGTDENWASVPAGVFPMAGSYGSINITVNFGQRPFAYTAPSGFKALVTTNLPQPTVVQGDDYFNTVLYTGTGASQSITGVGFQPDWVWIKERNASADHGLYDAVRGVQNQLESNTTTAETTEATGLTAFGSDGFTVGALAQLNTNTDTYVAWNWKANGAGVSNTAGTISSTVSVSTTSGFSIVTFTAPASGSETVGHGLGVAPSMMIWKSRSNSDNWTTYHSSLGNNAVFLNLTNAASSLTWGTINSTVFTADTGQTVTANRTYVVYCFAAVPGYSAFGSYTGNGSADGPFVFTGFRPQFIMIKASSSTGNWSIVDTSRDTYNVLTAGLYPNLSNAESDPGASDILSNGFKFRNTFADVNGSGTTYIFMAFAENPFKYSLAR